MVYIKYINTYTFNALDDRLWINFPSWLFKWQISGTFLYYVLHFFEKWHIAEKEPTVNGWQVFYVLQWTVDLKKPIKLSVCMYGLYVFFANLYTAQNDNEKRHVKYEIISQKVNKLHVISNWMKQLLWSICHWLWILFGLLSNACLQACILW